LRLVYFNLYVCCVRVSNHMPRPKVDYRPRAWPRVLVLALVGVAAAGCADSARFESSSYSSDRPAPPQNISSTQKPATSAHVEARPLAALTPPATVAAAPGAYAAQSPASYRSSGQYSDVTGSSVPPASSHWTWNGGAPVTVGYGETVEGIARKHGVPASAIMQTNGIRDAGQIRPGQRLVIPRHVTSATQTASHGSPRATGGNVHVVKSGETLMSISRRTGVTVTALARANKLQSTSKLSVGDRIAIPAGGHAVASARPASAPQVAQPQTLPVQKVASLAPVQTANVAKEEAPRKTDTVVKTAEPSGAMPSFRWPVRGRVIAGFGSKPMASIWRCRKALRSKPPTMASSLTPAMNLRAMAISC
jgi:LysM repeat protein